MVERIEETYTIIEELLPGDALRAQRAVTKDGLDVVVKTVEPVAPAVFLRALSHLADTTGPHNERVLAVGSQDRFVWLATEPVPGVTLRRLLTVERVLSSQAVAALGVQAALGLANLHEHGIVHGAVSPDTLIWTYEGDVVLIDAGLAQGQGGADLTGKAPPRNAAYVSPEEVLGRPLQQASDVYSLGVVLYQLVTGRLPFAGRNALAIAKGHASAPVPPPRRLAPTVSISLQGIILRAMAKLPEDRYASGRELFEALENELQAPQVPPRPSDVSIASRHKVRAWIATGVVLLAVVLVAAWTSGIIAQKRTVPNVVGATLSSAQARLSRVGLRLGTLGYGQGAGKSQNTILAQSPGAGATARRGSAVDLVEAGSAVRTVPSVVGVTQSAAEAAMTRAGLTLGSVASIYGNKAAAGTVAGQAPASGTTVSVATSVAITISRGPGLSPSLSAADVPNVAGQSGSQATATLRSAGFVVAVVLIPSSTATPYTVLNQTPASGALAPPGTTVTIVVSSGPQAP